MMRLLFLFVFLVINIGMVLSQDELLTPEQMKEDADYFFQTLHEKHPNPYYYYSKEEFKKRKDSIYSRLNVPLNREQFLWIISEINGFLDDHTAVRCLNSVDIIKMKTDTNIVLFPNVRIEEDRAFLKKNNLEITEINDKSVNAIIQDWKKYFNCKLPYPSNLYLMEEYFSFFLLQKYDIKAPFQVKYAHEDNIQTLKGYSGKEFNDEAAFGFRGGKIDDVKVYPFSSIAIYSLSSFDKGERDALFCDLNAFQNMVRNFNIKYVFYDVTMNPGGHENVLLDFCAEAFDIVKHDDLYFELRKTKRENQVNYENDVSILIDKGNEDAVLPDDRKIFVLQGSNTSSGADYFCRIVYYNELGTLVGQPTGEPTTAFTCSNMFTMPHSKINFSIATALYDFSDFYFEDETLYPDVYWDVNHTREFTEEELMEIVKQCATIKK